jgi:hypothetical protein
MPRIVGSRSLANIKNFDVPESTRQPKSVYGPDNPNPTQVKATIITFLNSTELPGVGSAQPTSNLLFQYTYDGSGPDGIVSREIELQH